MKATGLVVLWIWLGGALLMAGFYILSDRKACIDNEGIIKGVLWCDSQPKTQLGVSAYWFTTLMKGASWPLKAADTLSSFGDAHLNDDSPDRLSSSIGSYEQKYSCSQLVSDINDGSEAAGNRVNARFATEIFPEDDGRNELRLKAIATDYFGHEPTVNELRRFSAESVRLSLPVCMGNPTMSVERAVFIGADSVVPGKLSTEIR
ncbi:hypothetical protein J7355_09185 [Endozoicomonas sp. G2_2]|uniref:hypothetical protein n=1 Tax=Endozoicomonas sp. G2_2 TaxID=2821092 RepID=UPI001ADAB1C3|nr:hypothetical protein [Endozoicomonas sp. G2_2]MBO9470269.1 hypothetical protein [Endozoicomonas sp. G2_2]